MTSPDVRELLRQLRGQPATEPDPDTTGGNYVPREGHTPARGRRDPNRDFLRQILNHDDD